MAQVALSVVLLSAAGLFIGHLSKSGAHRSGVPPRPRSAGDPRSGAQRIWRRTTVRAYQELLARLETIPGVRSATISAPTPISGAGASRFANVEGYQERPEDRRYIFVNWVAPRYFETLGTPLLLGATSASQDRGGPRVAIINQAMARYYFGGAQPHRQALHVRRREPALRDRRRGWRREILRRFAKARCARSISTRSNSTRPASNFALRTSIDPETVGPAVRRTVRELLKTVPVVTDDHAERPGGCVHRSGAADRDAIRAIRRSGRAAGGHRHLRTAGVHGGAPHRTRSASAWRWARRRAPCPDGAGRGAGDERRGLAVGVPIAYWGERLAGDSSAFPIAFGAAAMMAITLVAAYVPARRAARVDPMEALRHE